MTTSNEDKDRLLMWKIGSLGVEKLAVEPEITRLDEVSQRLPGGVYTTFRTFAGRQRVVGLQAHLERLQHSAASKGWPGLLDPVLLRSRLARFLDEMPTSEARVRITLDTTHQPGTVYVTLQPMHPLPPEIYREGVKTSTCSLQRHQPDVKSTSFIAASRSLKASLPPDIFELLLVDESGRILEGMTSNFFGVLQGTILTAPEGVLFGVTRGVVLDLIAQAGLPADFLPVFMEQVPELEEAFLTSSSRGVVPVARIDEQAIGIQSPGPLTRQLMRLYEEDLERRAEPVWPGEPGQA